MTAPATTCSYWANSAPLLRHQLPHLVHPCSSSSSRMWLLTEAAFLWTGRSSAKRVKVGPGFTLCYNNYLIVTHNQETCITNLCQKLLPMHATKIVHTVRLFGQCLTVLYQVLNKQVPPVPVHEAQVPVPVPVVQVPVLGMQVQVQVPVLSQFLSTDQVPVPVPSTTRLAFESLYSAQVSGTSFLSACHLGYILTKSQP